MEECHNMKKAGSAAPLLIACTLTLINANRGSAAPLSHIQMPWRWSIVTLPLLTLRLELILKLALVHFSRHELLGFAAPNDDIVVQSSQHENESISNGGSNGVKISAFFSWSVVLFRGALDFKRDCRVGFFTPASLWDQNKRLSQLKFGFQGHFSSRSPPIITWSWKRRNRANFLMSLELVSNFA